ncbi:Y-family DNA polymerase [Flavobacteriaceae bacterium 14752]|uniref:Y-family DNA polymerase n=1 Tax=Mesohalobacter salilacus TaxID=2491711 RepID=UPI000F63A233|nr:Y-family DNA polymerase [Flavobacteriaceae bacterium 14752]
MELFALVDCNNFYASCERVFNPDLNGKPVAVLSNNDGCVIARSNEAKALGIPMGAPAFKYQPIFEKHKVHVFSSNYALYGDMSQRVMNTLSQFTPDVEVYSIDEAFLKFSGFEHFNLETYVRHIKATVDKHTGIPVSIGVAPTKALSKIANKIAKKFADKTGGVYVMQTETQRLKALKWLDIHDVWGIGRQHANRLKAKSVFKAYDFIQLPDDWVRKQMSVVGLRLKKELEGQPTLDLEEVATKKAIATTRSFDKQYSDYNIIRERVSSFAISCGEKLRRQHSHCQMIHVFLRTNKFRQDLAQYHRSTIVKTEYPTNSSIDLVKYAVKALDKIYKPEYQYKKAGVIVMELQPENTEQLSLFSQKNPKHHQLMQHIDHLNRSIGRHKVKFGSQDLGRVWKMRQERLSQRYSTTISESIVVKV